MNLINFLYNYCVCLYALGVGSLHEQAELNKELVNGISVYTMLLLQRISVTFLWKMTKIWVGRVDES